MDEYIRKCLKPILNNDVDNEIIEYIKRIDVVEDLEEFIDNIIDLNNPEHLKVYEKLKNKLFSIPKPLDNKGICKTLTPNEKSDNIVKRNVYPFPSLPHKVVPQKTFPDAKQSSLTNLHKLNNTASNVFNKRDSNNSNSKQTTTGAKKKNKFVKVSHNDFKSTLRNGRHPCNCEASIHSLINNCLKCGRIVCEQEGSGPCFFCDTLVCRNDEFRLLDSNSKESDELYNHIKNKKTSKEWQKAIELRDRLIKADKSGDHKRQIYDDQQDYYSSDKWNKGNNEIIQRIHKSRKDMKFALDFATRMVVPAETEYEKHKTDLLKGVNKLLDTVDERFPKNCFEGLENQIESSGVHEDKCASKELNNPTNFSKIKVANEAFLADIDRGMCLSMHQPYASLLVAGIKLHEGRTWYTEHRGRLWIHAASKQPNNEEILQIEKMYREIYDDPELVFPKEYPTSCLLGSIYVEKCLNQDQYRKLYPHGESDSPYVFICTNPMILPLFYPMQGQHKIFALTIEMHRTVKQVLMSSKWL